MRSAVAHLNLSFNIIGDSGAERFAGVLAQCPALVHLDLENNDIGTIRAERLRASWRGQASGHLLDGEDDEDEEDEEEEDV